MPCSNHGPWAAHLTRGVDVLATCCAGTETLARTYIKRKALAVKTNRKEEHNFDSRKGKKEGWREGRKEWQRNKGLAPKCCVHLPIYTWYFRRAAKSHAIYKCWVQNAAKTIQFTVQILAATRCKHHATICNICALCRWYFQHVANTIPLATLIFRKPQNSIQFTDAISKCCKRHAIDFQVIVTKYGKNHVMR